MGRESRPTFTTAKCPECGAGLPAHAAGASVTCAYCGSTLLAAPLPATEPTAPRVAAAADAPLVTCGECGHRNQPHYRFCLGCGGRL